VYPDLDPLVAPQSRAIGRRLTAPASAGKAELAEPFSRAPVEQLHARTFPIKRAGFSSGQERTLFGKHRQFPGNSFPLP